MGLTISIITATYNSAATISGTMQSVAQQDHPSVEHIIIDGHSEDETLEIVHRFPHTAIVVSEKDAGIYDAMNKGIRIAKGEVIGILNSDDMYAQKDVLSKIAAVFSDDKVDACYGDLQYIHALKTDRIRRTWKSGHFQPGSFYWGWMPPHPTFFVRKSVYEKVGIFNTDLKSAADYELMLRILMKHKMKAAYIPEVMVKMRTGGMSNASVWNRLRANREDRLAWQLNGLRPYFFTLYLKPLRKISQFILK